MIILCNFYFTISILVTAYYASHAKSKILGYNRNLETLDTLLFYHRLDLSYQCVFQNYNILVEKENL